MIAAASIEDRFWLRFCAAIDLDPAARNDAANPAATTAAVAARLGSQTAEHWRAIFEQADCCCSVVATLQDAAADPHFAARGVFAWEIQAGNSRMPALPVPIAPAFRRPPGSPEAAPVLGEANAELAGQQGQWALPMLSNKGPPLGC